MRKLLTAGLMLAVSASYSQADILPNLTPAQIAEALADTRIDPCYKLRLERGPHDTGAKATGLPFACYSTPYARVAYVGAQARKEYRTATAAEVTGGIVGAGELEIGALAAKAATPGGTGNVGMASVRTIVLMPAGSKDPSQAIQPTTTKERISTYKNGGATTEGRSLTARFPLKYLSERYEVHIVYDRATRGLCSDCRWQFIINSETR